MSKPILCLDFDGVIHLYTSPWTKRDEINDGPTPGAMEFIYGAQQHFKVVIYSSRSAYSDGLWAMKVWTANHMRAWVASAGNIGCTAEDILSNLEWTNVKPAAFLTIDDRAMCFTGVWPNPEELLKFKPWNKGGPVLVLPPPRPISSETDQ